MADTQYPRPFGTWERSRRGRVLNDSLANVLSANDALHYRAGPQWQRARLQVDRANALYLWFGRPPRPDSSSTDDERAQWEAWERGKAILKRLRDGKLTPSEAATQLLALRDARIDP